MDQQWDACTAAFPSHPALPLSTSPREISSPSQRGALDNRRRSEGKFCLKIGRGVRKNFSHNTNKKIKSVHSIKNNKSVKVFNISKSADIKRKENH